MKKYKSLLVGSLVLSVILFSPIASFAKDKNKNELKVEQHSSIKLEKEDYKRSSFLGKFSSWFGQRVNAETINAKLMPSISGIKAPTVLKVGETGEWTVKANDPQNGSLEYVVDWGDDNEVASTSKISQSSFTQTGIFTHAYANEGKYKVTFTVSNDAGLKTKGSVTVYVTGEQIENKPVISNLTVTSIKPQKATISWDTNLKSNSLVWYSKSSPVDTSGTANIIRKAKVNNHKIVLSKLEANTKYYVIVQSANNNGATTSSEISFTTLPMMIDTDPVITGLVGLSTVKVNETATVTVNAYDPQNGTLEYTADWGDNASIMAKSSTETALVQSGTFSHVYSSPGTYTATFTVKDDEGKKDSASMKITVTPLSTDTTKPVISNAQVLTGSTTSTISWKTDEPSTSEVFYSTNTPVDMNGSSTLSVKDETLVTNHSLNLSLLAPSTIYHFAIKSADASNNIATSSEFAFITN